MSESCKVLKEIDGGRFAFLFKDYIEVHRKGRTDTKEEELGLERINK